ncbi:MAG: MFS transporter [Treponema sp.]|jgi:MFS family permease|nr:MFS transporter [Treponema sp.]
MGSNLSPYRLRKARDIYNSFNIFNAISWNLLVGVIITLFALRLGATPTYIGLLSSSFYLALFLLPLGKLLTRRFSIIGIFSVTWIIRSICMIFAVAAPFFEYAGYRNTALSLIMLGVFLFHTFRGVGMIGNNPVLSLLASGPDRGSYMTQIQIVGGAIGMFASFLIAMILGMDPPVFIFSILLGAGIITGVISGSVIRKVPEPQSEEESQKVSLVAIFKDAFSQDALRHFMIILFLVVLVSGVTRTFAVVFAREALGHNDGLISLYAVFGGLGHLMVGFSVKFFVDRLGAKPLFLVCVIIGLVSIFSVVFFPSSAVLNVTGAILFMVFLFFMLNFGFLGSEGIAQTYFLALIPSDKMLDLGIVYFFVFGAAGAAGSFLSGLFLDLLYTLGVTPFISFRILFIVLGVLTVIALAMQKRMKSLGSLPLKGALEVIFSFRDLRAISLLDKLNKTEDSHEEQLLLGALHDTPSSLAIDGLLERARSPRLATRLEAIRALEKLHRLSAKAEKALTEDMINNQFTTAYISARTLGNHGCTDAVSLLREFAASNDYMLAGEAMIALAKMKDEEFRPEIEKIILNTNNPRVKIMGCEALGIYRCADSLSVLLEILCKAEPHLYLRDEAVLAIAAILGTQQKFYSVLVRYVADTSLAVTLGMDEAEAAHEFCKAMIDKKKKTPEKSMSKIINQIDVFYSAIKEYMENKNGETLSRWILELPDEYCRGGSVAKNFLAETVLDNGLSGYKSLRLLIVHWSAYELRIWAAKSK